MKFSAPPMLSLPMSALIHPLIVDCPSNLLLLPSLSSPPLQCQLLQEAFSESPEQSRGPFNPFAPCPVIWPFVGVSGLGKMGSRKNNPISWGQPQAVSL